ncbi:MAG: hypothetical protein HQL46_08915 [Gammaproteobacteria bacterium]|nr:hypothetical protein [Gammaproteobacteria bacterium]
MKIKSTLASAVALAIALPATAMAGVSGYIKNETAVYTQKKDAKLNEPARGAGDAGELMKFENSVRLFINQEFGEESSWHADLNLVRDSKAVNEDYEGFKSYTQNDALRELYVDTKFGDNIYVRIGKQQVVWGTADGMKLLDIMNPTDFRELNQNVMEDARIPVWMINTEMDVGDSGNIQFIVAQAKANQIAGLNENGDDGHPFLFKGVDTITGATNGFVNIAKDMGKTSGVFQNLLSMGGLNGLVGGPMSFQTVGSFTSIGTSRAQYVPDDGMDPANGVHQMTFADVAGQMNNNLTGSDLALFNQVFMGVLTAAQFQNGDNVLDGAANNAGHLFGTFVNYMNTSLVPGAIGTIPGVDMNAIMAGGTFDMTQMDMTDMNVQSLFALMPKMGINLDMTNPNVVAMMQNMDMQTLGGMMQGPISQLGATFENNSTNQFSSGTLNVENPQSAFDYMGKTTFATFKNFIGMNTSYRNMHEDEDNANIGFRFKNSTEGGTNYSVNIANRYDSNPYIDMHWEDKDGNQLSVAKTATTMGMDGSVVNPGTLGQTSTANTGDANTFDVTTLTLMNGDQEFDSNFGQTPATLVFEEKLNEIQTVGFSFDTAIDGAPVPLILRGEFAYDIGAKQPIVDKDELSIGNLTEALTMQDADMFKYVLGVDITVLSNMMVSTQLIQIYNLDYVDQGNRYTGDFSSMHLTNGLNQGDEIETFVSLFLSKPFGASQEHRWNNIMIAENGGGYWNRFDINYSFTDTLIGTFEWNNYWGDEDTTFGQFEKSSNVQLGLKWILE